MESGSTVSVEDLMSGTLLHTHHVRMPSYDAAICKYLEEAVQILVSKAHDDRNNRNDFVEVVWGSLQQMRDKVVNGHCHEPTIQRSHRQNAIQAKSQEPIFLKRTCYIPCNSTGCLLVCSESNIVPRPHTDSQSHNNLDNPWTPRCGPSISLCVKKCQMHTAIYQSHASPNSLAVMSPMYASSSS